MRSILRLLLTTGFGLFAAGADAPVSAGTVAPLSATASGAQASTPAMAIDGSGLQEDLGHPGVFTHLSNRWAQSGCNKTIIQAMSLKQSPHGLSHYEIAPSYKEEARLRDRKYTELFAYFLDRLKEKTDAGGKRLFDSCIACMGSSIRGQHVMKSVPMLIAGGGGKRIRRGESIILPKEDTPLSNLWLTLLQQAGVPAERFGLSTGTVPDILS